MDHSLAAPPAPGREEVVGRYLLRNVGDGDDAGLVELFRRSFEREPDLFQPRTPALWRSKYGAAEGPFSCVAEDLESGALVAHAGGLATVMRCRGVRRMTVQCADHMVAPEHRGGVAGHSLFARLMYLWIDNFCGLDRAFLGWGFPSRRDFRIGARQLGYRRLRPVEPLILPVDVGAGARAAAAGAEASLPADAGALWERTSGALEIAVERDQAYLERRYGAASKRAYRIVSLPGRALAVVRPAAFEPRVALVLEWIVDRGDDEGAELLLDGVGLAARRLDADRLAVWVAPADPAHAWLLRRGGRPHVVPLRPTGRSWDPDLPIEAVDAAVHFSLGDIDYL